MKHKILLAVAAVAVILGVVWIRDRQAGSFALIGVSDALYKENFLYLIDNNGEQCNFFKSDIDGRVQARIDVPKLRENRWSSYSSMTMDQDGQVYVYCYSRAMDKNEIRSEVYRCDFENGVLEKVWDLPKDKLIQIQVIDGCVYYVGGKEKGKYGFMQMDRQGRSHMCQELTETTGSVKDAYYHPLYGAMWADWSGRFYMGEKELFHEEPRDYANIRAEETGIYYMDASALTINRIPFEGGPKQTLFTAQDIRLMQRGLDYMDILPFHYNEDGGFTAGVDISPGRRVLGIFDGKGAQKAQISEMRLDLQDRVNMWVRTACVCLAVQGALYGLVSLWQRRSQNRVPVLVKLLGVTLPLLFLMSLILGRQLEQFLRERLMRRNYDLLYVMADLKLSDINPQDLMAIHLSEIPDDRRYRAIFKRKDYSNLPREVFDYHESAAHPVLTSAYFWLFLEKDGELRYVEVDGHHYYGARVMYDRGRSEIEKMAKAMKEKVIIETSYNDFSGDFIALYVPVINQDGVAVGVLESGISSRILAYEIAQQMEWIHGMLAGLMLALAVALTAVISFSLRPLKQVQAAVMDISRGNLGVHVSVRGRDEVAAIGLAFNNMSAKLKEQVDFIQACSDGYAAFVPQKIFEILDREDITKVRLGDQKEIQVAVLSIGSPQFEEQSRELSGDQLYRMINQMLREMIPVIAEEEGVVDHMKKDGLEAYFPGNCSRALRAASVISERLRAMRAGGSRIPIYRMCISFGIVKVGIVGGQERMEASTISELTSLSDFLKAMGERYGAQILLLETASARIPEFHSRYHARYIGEIFRRGSGESEGVYDVYDGDEAEDFKAKESTKELFEKAMNAYRDRDFYGARLAFAGVLKENGKDLAARAYVYRCDKYCQTGDEKAAPPYLEVY